MEILGGTTGVTNDWNHDGVNINTYSQILNNFGGECATSTLTTLTGFNDWAFINNDTYGASPSEPALNFRGTSNFVQRDF